VQVDIRKNNYRFFRETMRMNGHRYMVRAILTLVSMTLMLGVDLHAQKEESGRNQFVGKSRDEGSKGFLPGWHGHRGKHGRKGREGKHGLQGHPGPTGFSGAPGATGATGATGVTPCVIGSAYGDSQNDTPLAIQAASNTSTTPALCLAPLYTGSPTLPVADPFYFTPYVPATGTTPATGASYTITRSGTYLLQYGLEAVPSNNLVVGLKNTTASKAGVCWMCIQVAHQSGTGTILEQVGAVPLSLLNTNNNMVPAPSPLSPYSLSGFGQIYIQLDATDVVTLQIMVTANTTTYPNSILYVGGTTIMYPSPTTSPVSAGTPVGRGPTLTIMKIADPA
jgi:hypothetical protein